MLTSAALLNSTVLIWKRVQACFYIARSLLLQHTTKYSNHQPVTLYVADHATGMPCTAMTHDKTANAAADDGQKLHDQLYGCKRYQIPVRNCMLII